MEQLKQFTQESWNTRKYTDAKKLRDQRAKELRAAGWTVKTKKFDFSNRGYGILYQLEATKSPEMQEITAEK